MSSFPEHEDNIKDIKELGLSVDSIDVDGDPYETWDYDSLTYLTTELIGIIRGLKSDLESKQLTNK